MLLHSGIGSGSLAGVHPDSLVPATVTIPRLAVRMCSLGMSVIGVCTHGRNSPEVRLSGTEFEDSCAPTKPLEMSLSPDWNLRHSGCRTH